jgi:hypothetical protein
MSRDPVRLDRAEPAAMQRRVIGALHHDERVARDVLGAHEPGSAARIRAPTDAEAAALPDGVALEAAVAPDHRSLVVLDRPGAPGQPAADEVSERALADEADSGRIPLVRDRQAALAGHPSHLGLVQAANREFAERELPCIQRMQEVALILAGVHAAQEPAARADARVVPGGEALRTQALRVLEAYAKLDLAVAEDVGVRRTPGLQLGEEVRKHALAVLGLEAHLVQRDPQLLADAARVLEVGGGRAVAILVIGPVGHEEGFDLMTRVQEEGCRDGRIDAPGQADDDAGHGVSPPPCGLRRRRAAPASTVRANGVSPAGSRRPQAGPAGSCARRNGPRVRGDRAKACG